MRFIKKIFEKLKRPSPPFIAVFCVIFAFVITGSILTLIFVPELNAGHFVLFALTAIGLGYSVYLIFFFAPKIKAKILGALRRHEFTNRILENYGFRTVFFGTLGFVINLAYVALQLGIAIFARSVWNGTIAAFYLVLIVIKGVALSFGRQKNQTDQTKQIRAYRFCAVMLNLLTFAISGILVLINTADMYFEYAGVMIYAVALFTFYRIIVSIVQCFKARKQDNLTVQALRNVNLASALYSVLVLQVAMFQAFSENANHFSNNVTGAAVAILIFAISNFMLVKANKISKNQ